jgi:hypothetical protein
MKSPSIASRKNSLGIVAEVGDTRVVKPMFWVEALEVLRTVVTTSTVSVGDPPPSVVVAAEPWLLGAVGDPTAPIQ